MNESIGQIIKKLRKERDFTQEELAEQLNLSAQAISKWENGTSLPDISQVVPIANLFGVTTDLLLGRSGMNDKEEVKKILQEIEGNSTAEGYAILQEGLRRYPSDQWLLMNCLEYGIGLAYPENGEPSDAEEAKKIYKECERMASLVISYSKSVNDVLRARNIMVYLHSAFGNTDAARAHADYFPYRSDLTIHAMYAYIFHNTKDYASEKLNWEADFSYHLESLLDTITSMGNACRKLGKPEDALTVYEKALQIIDLVTAESTVMPQLHYRNTGDDLYLCMAEASLEAGKEEDAFAWLEKLVRFETEVRTTFRKGMKLNSPLLRDMPVS